MTERGLETVLGEVSGRVVRRLVRFTRGAQSENYAGVWDDDGSRFVLKLVPAARAKQYARLVDHLEKTEPGPAVRESAPRLRFDVDGRRALVLDWCEGEPLGFGALCAGDGVERLVADYAVFSATVQRAGELYPACDYAAWRAEALDSPFAAALPPDLAETDFSLLAREPRVIHGDFQADNLRFTAGRLTGVLDLEELRLGSPLEDFARYVCQGADRLAWWAWRRRRAVFAGVARLRAATGAPAAAWRAAVYGQYLRKIHKTIRKGCSDARMVVNLKWRLGNYVKLTGRTS